MALATRLVLATSAAALALPGVAAARPLAVGPSLKHGAWIAAANQPLLVRDRPDGNRIVARLAAMNPIDGARSRLLVLARRRDGLGRYWLRVRLPARPNSNSGWILARRVTRTHTGWAVHVRRSDRLMTVFHAGHVVRRLRVVVGAPGTPTPPGLFAIYARSAGNAASFTGSWVLHLTAHSNVLDDFGGGEGRVGLHGRGGASLLDPLGAARSHGCVRLANTDIRWLSSRVRSGTPVFVD